MSDKDETTKLFVSTEVGKIVGMEEHHGDIFVACQEGVFILRGGRFERIEFVQAAPKQTA